VVAARKVPSKAPITMAGMKPTMNGRPNAFIDSTVA
jgi:hypothetical protein